MQPDEAYAKAMETLREAARQFRAAMSRFRSIAIGPDEITQMSDPTAINDYMNDTMAEVQQREQELFAALDEADAKAREWGVPSAPPVEATP